MAGLQPSMQPALTISARTTEAVRRTIRRAGVKAELHVFETMPMAAFPARHRRIKEVLAEHVRFIDKHDRNRVGLHRIPIPLISFGSKWGRFAKLSFRFNGLGKSGGLGVVGSNPAAPTNRIKDLSRIREFLRNPMEDFCRGCLPRTRLDTRIEPGLMPMMADCHQAL